MATLMTLIAGGAHQQAQQAQTTVMQPLDQVCSLLGLGWLPLVLCLLACQIYSTANFCELVSGCCCLHERYPL